MLKYKNYQINFYMAFRSHGVRIFHLNSSNANIRCEPLIPKLARPIRRFLVVFRIAYFLFIYFVTLYYYWIYFFRKIF